MMMSRFIYLFVLCISAPVFSMECSSYFSSKDLAQSSVRSEGLFVDSNGHQNYESRSGAEIMIRVLQLIDSAKKGSTVYLFTPQMNAGSVGNTVLMQMISRTDSVNNLRFKVHFTGKDHSTDKMIRYLNESSRIEVYERIGGFSGIGLEILNNKTFMLVETDTSIDFIFFDGALNRSGLKNDDNIKARYGHFGRITTSSFKQNVPFKEESLSFLDPSFDMSAFLQFRFVIETVSALHTQVPREPGFVMTDADRVFLDKTSYELAVQLYNERFHTAPAVKLNVVEILNQVVSGQR